MAKTLTLSLAVVAVVLLGAAAGQPQGRQRVLAPIGQFGRNTAARLAAAGADGIAAVAKIGTNVVGSVQDTVNTGLDLGSSLTRTGTTFVGNRATSLADTGSTIATFSQTAVKTGVRIGQDAVKAGLAVAGNGADAVNGLAGGRLGLGNRLVQSGLGAAGRVTDKTADTLANLEDLETKAVQRALGATAGAVKTGGTWLDARVTGGNNLAKGLVGRGAEGTKAVINGVAGAAVGALNRVADKASPGIRAAAVSAVST